MTKFVVEGNDLDGALVTRNVPIIIGGVDSNGRVQTLSVDNTGSIGTGTVAASNANSNGQAKSLVVKNAAGTLYGFSVLNNAAYQQYVQYHDASALPADGVTPIQSIPVPPGNTAVVDFTTKGRSFSTGIVLCSSSTAATKTIGAGTDCVWDAQYS